MFTIGLDTKLVHVYLVSTYVTACPSIGELIEHIHHFAPRRIPVIVLNRSG